MVTGAGALRPNEVLTVPHERTGVGAARHAVCDQLAARGIATEVLDDAVLVVSELVSNSVKHAAPLPGGQIAVGWGVDGGLLHLEITDGGAGTRPQAGIAALGAIGGRGLDIVRMLSAQWGVLEADGRTTVWAELPLTAGSPEQVLDLRGH
jgi:anti-sigma regulatory factor (Ser/Thr protein kinase)